jgi:hypothetical protein
VHRICGPVPASVLELQRRSQISIVSDAKYILTGYMTNLTNKAYKKLELIPSYGAYPVLYGDPRVFGLTLTAKIQAPDGSGG